MRVLEIFLLVTAITIIGIIGYTTLNNRINRTKRRALHKTSVKLRSIFKNQEKTKNFTKNVLCKKHVVFTTFKCPKCDSLRKIVEENTLHTWSEMEGVTFRALANTKTNKHGVPLLPNMYMEIIKQCPYAKTYTYINGDILGSNDFVKTIDAVLNLGDFLLVGRRTNVQWDKKYSAKDTDYSFDSHFERGALFRTNAQDYFTVTKNAIDWSNIPPFVIGRPAYDNWLVDHVYHKSSVALIDATKTVRMVHQTGKDGNVAHGGSMVKSNDDKQYNRIIGKGKWDHGRTSHAQWETLYDQNGNIVIKNRKTKQIQYESKNIGPIKKQSYVGNGRFIANSSITAPTSKCKTSKPPTLQSKWSQNDCAMVPLNNTLRLDFLLKILTDTTHILTKYMPHGSIPPLLTGGTLLGAIRSQNILPWTNDADLDISPALYTMLDNNIAMRKDFFHAGYIVFKHLGTGRVCAHTGHKDIQAFGTWEKCGSAEYFYYEKGVAYVDMYKAVIEKNKQVGTKENKFCKSLVWDDYLPPRKINILKNIFYVPSKSSTIMCKLWGENWRTPVKGGSIRPFCNSRPEKCTNMEWTRTPKRKKDIAQLSCVEKHIDIYIDLISTAARYNVRIFPRNGFLLGIVRHKGYLPNEGIDADLGIIESDFKNIKINGKFDGNMNGKFGTYKLQLNKELPNWRVNNWNGIHPKTGRKLAPSVKVFLNNKKWIDICFFYDFDADTLFYPMWAAKWNLKGRIKESKRWAAQGSSAVFNKNSMYNLFNKSSFASMVPADFYNKKIMIPFGYKSILIGHYGKNWMITEKRHNWESKVSEIQDEPRKICSKRK